MDGVVYACDIGSVPKGNFAWSRVVALDSKPTASDDIDDLLVHITDDAKGGASVALGFESPLFLPVPLSSEELCHGRKGEGQRSMFACAGATAATLGVHEAAWILRGLYERLGKTLSFTADWEIPWRATSGFQKLFLWEAFVSSKAHSKEHRRDAATAARYFLQEENDFAAANAVVCDHPLSLVHCAAMWSGWTQDMDGLHGSYLVLKPSNPYGGPIDPA